MIEASVQSYFQKSLIGKGLVPAGFDPRHVEGYIRLAHPTLGSLSWPEIRREVRIAIACIREGGSEAAERNAVLFGL